MTILSELHQVYLKRARKLAWTRPFQVQTYGSQDTADYYDTPSGAPTLKTFLGDWAWGPQVRYVGQLGVQIPEGGVMLCTDIIRGPELRTVGARLVLDGITCAIDRVTEYPEIGEIVVAGTRVSAP